MDTKWKNRKKGISFIIFFAGVSLTLDGGVNLLQNLPGDFWRQPEQVLQDDYQQSNRFREYIAGRLETFLAMATDSYNGYYDNYGYAYPGVIQEGVLGQESTEAYAIETPLQVPLEDLPAEEREEYISWWQNNYQPEIADGQWEEKRKEQCRKLARQYHDSIKTDQNLLYSIAFDSKVLYSNSDLLPTDGNMSLPEGYNFILRYEGGKVRICKDGQELDVYGDGYYREGSPWYVPGYRNFTVDEEMKKAVICMAVAQEPVLYTESSYARGSYLQMDNTLYWLRYNTLQNRTRLVSYMVTFGAGLALPVLSLLCRKSRREASASIARFTGKIWFEGKVLLCLLTLYLIFLLWITQAHWDYGDFWYEWEYMTEVTVDYGITASYIGNSFTWMLRYLPGWSYTALFWLVYLAGGDLRRNQKVWQHGLIAKLHRAFSARDLGQPLPVKTAHRSGAAFAAAAVYGLIMLAGGVSGYVQGSHSDGAVWGMGSLFFLILVGFLVLQYRIGVKNMETARDLEALSKRIRDIRSGNYAGYKDVTDGNGLSEDGDPAKATDAAGAAAKDENASRGRNSRMAGHDLEDTFSQLEDIRQGMACAVDEQMRSERMKVELIANVSHDIKTPLTSIISYVQFLKEEKDLPDHVQDYVKILDEKSQRLKNMVQDVFAVSKAASGELPMHMEELDFGKLLCQTLADMEEQIGSSKVSFRTEIPESPVMILADGQRMYRVFQNLFQNAIQYSLDGSRVFVTLQTDGRLAVASVKNTSHLELEKDKDFTERFARGDQSRTDGGSGLGLSIARSFTEACGGTFSWETNADLFVVTVSFRILEHV